MQHLIESIEAYIKDIEKTRHKYLTNESNQAYYEGKIIASKIILGYVREHYEACNGKN